MILGIKPKLGEQGDLNKWYYGIEIIKCNPQIAGILKPYIFIWCIKWLDFGEPYMLNGRKEKRKGFTKRFEFPYGIRIEFFK